MDQGGGGAAVGAGQEGGSSPGKPAARAKGALAAFAILFVMNLLDYMDRNSLYAVLPQVIADLRLSNAQAGRLATYFLISYSIFGLFTGYAGDRMRRTTLLGLGVGVWSLATIGSGLARSYGQLATARAILGIGEATYGVIAPTILLDLFPRSQRARVMSAFYLAMPLGSALGYAVGGALGARHGWNTAFFVVGAPGLLAALGAFWLPEPVRGASEGVDEARLRAHERAGATWSDYHDLMVNSSYTYSVFGMTAYTFAIGGLLVWTPHYLIGTRGMSQERANAILGLVTLFAAVIGMSVGGWVSDRLARRDPRALFVVPGLAMLGAVPFILVGLFSTKPAWIFAGIFLAELLMFVNTGPCNAVIANVVTPNLRSAAYAAGILVMHFLGDIWSPWLIGAVADLCAKPDTMATELGQVLARIGAVPTQAPGRDRPENLVAGMLVVVPAVMISGIVLLAGARHLPREMALMLAKLKATPQPAPASRRSTSA